MSLRRVLLPPAADLDGGDGSTVHVEFIMVNAAHQPVTAIHTLSGDLVGTRPKRAVLGAVSQEIELVPTDEAAPQTSYQVNVHIWSGIETHFCQVPAPGDPHVPLTWMEMLQTEEGSIAAPPLIGVTLFNTRSGSVVPQAGDYQADLISVEAAGFNGHLLPTDDTVQKVAQKLDDLVVVAAETDPVFGASPASGISSQDLLDWATAYGWGDHSGAGYLLSETDPVFGASPASGISSQDLLDWETAYGWGDHSGAGYLTAGDVDDVPVDGETSAPVSSNWAFDHAGAAAAHTAANISVAANGFNGNLAVTDDTVQKIAQKLDDLVVGGGDGDVIDGGILATGLTFPVDGLHILDTNASHDLILSPGSDLTADRTLTITTGDADRTLTLTADASVGGTNTGDQDLSGYVPFTVLTDSEDPTGFLNPESIDVAYNAPAFPGPGPARAIVLTGTLEYYWHGVKHTLTSPWTSDQHASGDGTFYLSSTDGTTFAWSTSPWSFEHIQVARVTVADTGATVFGQREPHGIMPFSTHQALHSNIGTWRKSGLTLDPATYTVNTASDAATTPGFIVGVVVDEDLETTIPAWPEGTYTTVRIGAASAAVFDVAASFPFRSSGSYILINNPTTGAETATVTGRYVNVYQLVVPVTSDADSQKYRMLMLQPQVAYTTLAAAQAEDPRGLALGSLTSLASELVFHARITYVTAAADSNTGKCRIATGGVTYISGGRASQVSISGYTAPTAASVSVAATPSNYTAATPDVEAHLVGVDTALASAHAAVTLAGTPDYITITGQEITRNAIDLATDVTGALPAASVDFGTGTNTWVWTSDGVGGEAWAAPAASGSPSFTYFI